MPAVYPELCREKALVFRMVHMDNLAGILAKGAPCASSVTPNDKYVQVGSPEIINKRRTRVVPIQPGGVLSDYVPFYFTRRSQMLYNNLTGYGLPRQKPQDIALLVSSVPHLVSRRVPFVFTSGHALMVESRWFSDPKDLDVIDWDILRRSDFKRTDADPGKSNRYQAELLIHRHVRVGDLLGLACFDGEAMKSCESLVSAAGVECKVVTRERWYPR